MKVTNVYDAKTRLSQLIEEAVAGEEVVIGKFGKPLVRLVPYQAAKPQRRFGVLRDKIRLPDNFDDESPAINQHFYGDDNA